MWRLTTAWTFPKFISKTLEATSRLLIYNTKTFQHENAKFIQAIACFFYLFFLGASPVQFKYPKSFRRTSKECPNSYCPIRDSKRTLKIILIGIRRDAWLHVCQTMRGQPILKTEIVFIVPDLPHSKNCFTYINANFRKYRFGFKTMYVQLQIAGNFIARVCFRKDQGGKRPLYFRVVTYEKLYGNLEI